MGIKGSKKSHIQLPKSILEDFSVREIIKNEKGFSEPHNYVYQMDMDGDITKQDIKDVNTQFGYFEDVIESEVLATYETAFGDMKAKVVSACKNIKNNKPPQLELSQSDWISVVKYCSLCYVRSQEFVKNIKDKSLFMDMVDNEPQNTVVYVYLKNPDIVDCLFDNLNLHIVMNNSNVGILLPQSGLIMRQNSKTKEMSVFVPITDKICLKLSSKVEQERVLFMDTNVVDKLNKFLIQHEYDYNHKAVYSKCKGDLERYQEYIKSLQGN